MMSSDQSIADLEKGSIFDNLIRQNSYISEEESEGSLSDSNHSAPNYRGFYIIENSTSAFFVFLFLFCKIQTCGIDAEALACRIYRTIIKDVS